MEPKGPQGVLPRCSAEVGEGEICEIARSREILPNGRSYEVLDLGPNRLDDTDIFTVPERHIFVLGDHRDDAADRRLPQPIGRGFVPLEAVIGVFEAVD